MTSLRARKSADHQHSEFMEGQRQRDLDRYTTRELETAIRRRNGVVIVEPGKPTPYEILDEIRTRIRMFHERCTHYTDTGEAWDVLRMVNRLAGGGDLVPSEIEEPA